MIAKQLRQKLRAHGRSERLLRIEKLEDRCVLTALPLLPLYPVSGASPFDATYDVGQKGTVYPNSELEPQIAVDPNNASNVVAVWQQDRWSGGGARGLGIGVSTDAGVTWTNSFVPDVSLASGGNATDGTGFKRATDPWVSIGPDGTVYVASLSVTPVGSSVPIDTAIIAITATIDTGSTTKLDWNSPVVIKHDVATVAFDMSNDKESITADPLHPGTAYMVWDRSDFPGGDANFLAGHALSFRAHGWFSRTTDGGVTWEQPREIFAPLANQWTIGHQIVVMPATSAHPGRLVDAFTHQQGSGGQPAQADRSNINIMYSDDQGVTWSNPIVVGSAEFVDVFDPDTGAPVRTGEPIPDVAVDPGNGSLYITWLDSRFTKAKFDDVVLSASTDGGSTWSTPIKVNQTPSGLGANGQAFVPSVAVADNHTVAVTYYDFRNNTAGPGLPTDYWIAHAESSPTLASSWASNGDQALTDSSFNLEEAPVARGYFIGDYQGLAAVGNSFYALFTQAGLESGNPASNIFFRDPPPAVESSAISADAALMSLTAPAAGMAWSLADHPIAAYAGNSSDKVFEGHLNLRSDTLFGSLAAAALPSNRPEQLTDISAKKTKVNDQEESGQDFDTALNEVVAEINGA